LTISDVVYEHCFVAAEWNVAAYTAYPAPHTVGTHVLSAS